MRPGLFESRMAGSRLRLLAVAVLGALGLGGLADGAMGPAVQVSQGGFVTGYGGPVGSMSAVAASGKQLVVWSAATEDRGGYSEHRVWGRIVDEHGVAQGEQFAISSPPPEGSPTRAVATDVAARGRRGEFLVVWSEENPYRFQDGSKILARRIGSNGEPLAAPFLVASSPQFEIVGSAAIAYGSARREFMVSWSGYAKGSEWSEIFGARIPAGSSETPEAFRIWPTDGLVGPHAHSPDVAYDSRRRRYLAVWDLSSLIYARKLPADPSGELGRTRRISPLRPPYRDGNPEFQNPIVTYSRTTGDYAAGWTFWNGDIDFPDWAAYARLVRPDDRSRPRGPAQLVSDADPSSEAASAFLSDIEALPDTRRFLVALGQESRFGGVFARKLGASLKPGRLRRVNTYSSSSSFRLAYSNMQSAFRGVWIQPIPDDGGNERHVFTRQL